MRFPRLALPLVLASTLVGCASTGSGSGSNEGDLLAALTAAYTDLEAQAAPLNAAFRERVRVGMSTADVRATVSAIASEAGRSAGQTYAAGEMVVRRESGGAACFSGGAPDDQSSRTEAGVEVLSWEYRCVSSVFALRFRDGRLASVAERPAN